jgi:hypothetical protein
MDANVAFQCPKLNGISLEGWYDSEEGRLHLHAGAPEGMYSEAEIQEADKLAEKLNKITFSDYGEMRRFLLDNGYAEEVL